MPLVGVCWPNTGPGTLEPPLLRKIRLLGVNALRVHATQHNPEWKPLIAGVAAQDLWPIVILDLAAGDFDQELAQAEAFMPELFAAAPWLPVVELCNEPSGRFTAEQYAEIVRRLIPAIRAVSSTVTILVAAECFDFGSGRAHAFWSALKNLVPADLFDAVAIHPYRNPKPWWWSTWGSRETEWKAVVAATRRRVFVTEVGWHATEDAALNLPNEIDLLRSLGAEAICIYAMVTRPGEWGLFDDDGTATGGWRLTPAAAAIAHYLQEKPL